MKRFRFELERLTRVRRLQEELERARWLEAEARARAAELELERIGDSQALVTRELGVAQARERLDLAASLHGQRELERLGRVRRAGEERLRTMRFQAERLRAPWLERRREVGALERLEERRRGVFRREAERTEAKGLDEIALERAFRDPGRGARADEPTLQPALGGRRSPHGSSPDPDPR